MWGYDGFAKSHTLSHCEECNGCEAEPKQTRSQRFTKARGIAKYQPGRDSSLRSEQAPQSNKYRQLSCRRLLRFARNDKFFEFLRIHQTWWSRKKSKIESLPRRRESITAWKNWIALMLHYVPRSSREWQNGRNLTFYEFIKLEWLIFMERQLWKTKEDYTIIRFPRINRSARMFANLKETSCSGSGVKKTRACGWNTGGCRTGQSSGLPACSSAVVLILTRLTISGWQRSYSIEHSGLFMKKYWQINIFGIF